LLRAAIGGRKLGTAGSAETAARARAPGPSKRPKPTPHRAVIRRSSGPALDAGAIPMSLKHAGYAPGRA